MKKKKTPLAKALAKKATKAAAGKKADSTKKADESSNSKGTFIYGSGSVIGNWAAGEIMAPYPLSERPPPPTQGKSRK